jgi:hypothetical protein
MAPLSEIPVAIKPQGIARATEQITRFKPALNMRGLYPSTGLSGCRECGTDGAKALYRTIDENRPVNVISKQRRWSSHDSGVRSAGVEEPTYSMGPWPGFDLFFVLIVS